MAPLPRSREAPKTPTRPAFYVAAAAAACAATVVYTMPTGSPSPTKGCNTQAALIGRALLCVMSVLLVMLGVNGMLAAELGSVLGPAAACVELLPTLLLGSG